MAVFKGSGHCTILERHSEFNRMVEGFLREALGGLGQTDQRPRERARKR
jgi:hypothetical protein